MKTKSFAHFDSNFNRHKIYGILLKIRHLIYCMCAIFCVTLNRKEKKIAGVITGV